MAVLLVFTSPYSKKCEKNIHYVIYNTSNGLNTVKSAPLVQALRLCTGRTAHSGSRGIALLFHDNGNRRGWGVSVTPWALFTPGKDPVPIVQEAGWAPGSVWTGAGNFAPTGIQSRTVQPVASRYTEYATRPTEASIEYI